MFRLRITLLSVFFSGIVLAAFGLSFLSLTSKMELGRIDREINTLGESQLIVLHPKEHWEQFDTYLRNIYGDRNINQHIVQVIGGDRIFYISSGWPEQISVSSFPEFDPHVIPPPRRGLDTPIPVHPQKPLPSKDMKKPLFRTFRLPGKEWRVGIMGNSYFTIIIGIDLTEYNKDAAAYSTLFMISIPIALLLLAAGGWIVSHRALAPVRLIAQSTRSITARGLHKRIPDSRSNSEFQELIRVINEMLDRLETGFDQAVRFSADAAHELQTPLTILQGVLDDAIRNTADGSEEQQRCSNLLEEVQRLKVITQKLLILSRADAGQLNLVTAPVNLSRLLEEIIEDISITAPHLAIEHRISPDIMVTADPDLIRQVVQNLGTNAVKYNIANGMIRFSLTADHDMAVLDVTNTGFPIQPEEQGLIFERFHRVDKSRSNKIPGAGLGLSLAKEITRAHNGLLFVRTEPEQGLNIFTLQLPVTRESRMEK